MLALYWKKVTFLDRTLLLSRAVWKAFVTNLADFGIWTVPNVKLEDFSWNIFKASEVIKFIVNGAHKWFEVYYNFK